MIGPLAQLGHDLRVAPASTLAPKTIFWNRSGVTRPEQEKVASRPPGASSFRPSRLMSL